MTEENRKSRGMIEEKKSKPLLSREARQNLSLCGLVTGYFGSIATGIAMGRADASEGKIASPETIGVWTLMTGSTAGTSGIYNVLHNERDQWASPKEAFGKGAVFAGAVTQTIFWPSYMFGYMTGMMYQ